MSRKNFKSSLIILLACTALLFAALGCESGSPMAPDSNSNLSTPNGASFANVENVNG